MEGIKEEPYFDDEFEFDPQDSLEYNLQQRDYFGKYLNPYGDVKNYNPDREKNSRLTSSGANQKTKEFYEAQRKRFWDRSYDDFSFSSFGKSFYLEENTGQLFVEIRIYKTGTKKMFRLTDKRDSNKFLPLNSIALQGGSEIVREGLEFKDYNVYYDHNVSDYYGKQFYETLKKNGWEFNTKNFRHYIHFEHKNDLVIIKFRSKEIEITNKGSIDFFSLESIAEIFGKGGASFVRVVLGVKNFDVKKKLNLEKTLN